eukprot:PhM_4_TR3589/c0_g1_i1/m.57014
MNSDNSSSAAALEVTNTATLWRDTVLAVFDSSLFDDVTLAQAVESTDDAIAYPPHQDDLDFLFVQLVARLAKHCVTAPILALPPNASPWCCVRLLLSHGANIDAVDAHTGDTPMHHALRLAVSTTRVVTFSQVRELIVLLASHGADLSITNNAEQTPLQAALKVVNGVLTPATALLLKYAVATIGEVTRSSQSAYSGGGASFSRQGTSRVLTVNEPTMEDVALVDTVNNKKPRPNLSATQSSGRETNTERYRRLARLIQSQTFAYLDADDKEALQDSGVCNIRDSATKWTLLHCACAALNLDAVRALVEFFPLPNFVNACDADGWTAPHICVAYMCAEPALDEVSCACMSLLLPYTDMRSRMHSQGLVRIPLLHQTLTVRDSAKGSNDGQQLVLHCCERLPWMQKRVDRFTAQMWEMDKNVLEDDAETFLDLVESTCVAARVTSFEGTVVEGECIFRGDVQFTYANIIMGHPGGVPTTVTRRQSIAAGTGTSSELPTTAPLLVTTPSLLSHYFATCPTASPPPAFRAWRLGNTLFTFERVKVVKPGTETYEVLDVVDGVARTLHLTRATRGFHADEDLDVRLRLGSSQQYSLGELHWTDDKGGARWYSPASVGPTPLHWLESVPTSLTRPHFNAFLKTMTTSHTTAAPPSPAPDPELLTPNGNAPSIAASTVTSNNGTTTDVEAVTNPTESTPALTVRTLRYMRFFSSMATWPKDPNALDPVALASPLYFLHCACAIGDADNITSILTHYEETYPDLVNTPRTVSTTLKDVNIIKQDTEYCMSLAAKYGHHNITRDLVEKHNAEVDVEKHLPLRLAIANSQMRVAEWLVKRGCKPFHMLPSGSHLPSMEEISFVERHALLSDRGRENVLRDHVPKWCERDAFNSLMKQESHVLREALLLINLDAESASTKIADYVNTHQANYHIILDIRLGSGGGTPQGLGSSQVSFDDPSQGDLIRAFKVPARKIITISLPLVRETFESCFYDGHRRQDTAIPRVLRRFSIRRVSLCGRFLQSQILRSAYDALRLNYEVSVLLPLCVCSVHEAKIPFIVNQIRASGGVVVDTLEEAEFALPQSAKPYRRNPVVEHLLRVFLHHPNVRYDIVLEEGKNVQLLRVLNGFDFGSELRNGELFLYLALLCSRGGNQTRTHLTRFTMEGTLFELPDFDSLRYPLHHLMLKMKCCKNARDRQAAERLLLKCIAFMNEAPDPTHDLLGSQTTQFPGGIHPRQIAALQPEMRHPEAHNHTTLDNDSIFVTPAKRPPLDDSNNFVSPPGSAVSAKNDSFSGLPWPTCPHDLTEHNLMQFEHITCCTPLMLAVRFGFPQIVTAMLEGGLFTVKEEVGRDHTGTRYTCEVVGDIWCALPVEPRSLRETEVVDCPPLIYALRSIQVVNRSLALLDERKLWARNIITDNPLVPGAPGGSDKANDNKDDDDSSDSDDGKSGNNTKESLTGAFGYVPAYPPGCGAHRNQQERRQDATSSMKPVRLSPEESTWVVCDPADVVVLGEWCCSSCGSPSRACRANDIPALKRERAQWIACCEALILASLKAHKRVRVLGVDTEAVTVRIGGSKKILRAHVDRCGIFHRYGHSCGLSLLLQYSPSLLPLLLNESFFKNNFQTFRELESLMADCRMSVQIVRREGWASPTSGCSESVVMDHGLGLLHWAALHNDVKLLQRLDALYSVIHSSTDGPIVSTTLGLGYTPIHYAAYACSHDVLEFVTTTLRGRFEKKEIIKVLNTPRAVELLTPKQQRKLILAQRRRREQELEDDEEPDCIPGVGESCGHIAASFGHARIISQLLDNGLDVTQKAKGCDVHDVALSLLHKHQRNAHDEHLQRSASSRPLRFEDIEREEQELSVLESTVSQLHELTPVRKKLQSTAQRTFFRLAGPYVLFLALLILGAFLDLNYVNTSGSYAMSSYVTDQLQHQQFVLDFTLGAPDWSYNPPLGKQFKADMSDIATADHVVDWITTNFRRQLFNRVGPQPSNNTRIVYDGKFVFVGASRLTFLRVKPNFKCNAVTRYDGVMSACHKKFVYDPESKSAPQIRREAMPVNVTRRNYTTTLPYKTWSTSGWEFGFWSPATELWYPINEGNILDIPPATTYDELDDQFGVVKAVVSPEIRFVTVQFLLYNPNQDTFANVGVFFELHAAGAIRVHTQLRPLRLRAYATPVDWFRFVVELILVGYALRFAHEVALEVLHSHYRYRVRPPKIETSRPSRSSRLARLFSAVVFHFKELNLINITIMALLFVKLGVHVEVLRRQGKIDDIALLSTSYREFPEDVPAIAHLYGIELRVESVCILFCFVKLLKYIRLIPQYGPIAVALFATVKHRSTQLFVVILLTLAMGVILTCHLAFSSRLGPMRSFLQTLYIVFRMISGEGNFDLLYSGDVHLGPFIWFVVTSFLSKLLLSIFIGLLGAAFSNETPKAEKSWNCVVASHYTAQALSQPSLTHPPLCQLRKLWSTGGEHSHDAGSGGSSWRSVPNASLKDAQQHIWQQQSQQRH